MLGEFDTGARHPGRDLLPQRRIGIGGVLACAAERNRKVA
jgi:hypothetical protein